MSSTLLKGLGVSLILFSSETCLFDNEMGLFSNET